MSEASDAAPDESAPPTEESAEAAASPQDATPVALGTLAHEWGHFAGARWFGGIAPTRPMRSLFPIFDLDLQNSDPRAFGAMSVGGNPGHSAVVLVALL